MLSIVTFFQSLLFKIILAVALIGGSLYGAYSFGINHQKGIDAQLILKANVVVEKKNDTVQNAADTQAKIQIEYRDRIVTKYQTITKKVIQYEKTPDADVVLDSEFVRLHNDAAFNSSEITESASGTNGDSTESIVSPVTTGQAIEVIVDNYEAYYNCKRVVDGWQLFYTNLQHTINDK